ncbi:aminotransferase class I/II-fold pyridoxal phosphate-dependent enzyme [Paenibacillus sabinae]|uniref:Orn/Lys/Arg decarboxylase major region n=1 Tax=Paenibacillus sabinae T27 TaxID=1268072 RepID=X4ZBQ9_9BACL|nr:aminotransferase class I/II-fold pyridoxal phosphate-dependent enzyme [Paenibacillus sabinae]AHV94957.1 Orn/Lys/Arg decarboxylase major region [Paenibacillus sabinae T27]
MKDEERQSAPLYEMLERYKAEGKISFHVPGHKNGQAYRTDKSAGLLDEVMTADITEISGSDDLHHPEGVILEAQRLAADCFGAEESFFLVGGSTAGNLALILTVCAEPGTVLLVQRNVHKSVINGLMLAGARAVFLDPLLDDSSGLAVAPSEETVRKALAAWPEAAGLLVTMPNYYGMGSDLAPLARACHDSGVPLLVDEAHGAHYGQHPELPPGALSCGADGVVQSTHKMLAAMTMGAMLHVQGPRLDRALLRQRLAMVQSSSPSYPVMASLDLARRLLHSRRADAFTAGLAAVETVQRGLAELPRFKALRPQAPQRHTGGGESEVSAPGQAPRSRSGAYTTQDPFKVVIYDATGVLSGFELQAELERRGCVPEMSDERHVVLLFSLGSRAEDAVSLLAALRDIDRECPPGRPATSGSTPVSTWNNFEPRSLPAPVQFSLRPVGEEETECIKLEESEGRVAAEMVIPYPPGIPLLYPGEVITGEINRRLRSLAEAGARFHSVSDLALQTIKVYITR